MIEDIFVAFWFFVPAGIANVAPIIVAKIPWLQRYTAPLDGGLYFRGQRLFGAHKTWRGLIAGVIAATAVLWLQQFLVMHIPVLNEWTAQINYARLPVLLLGPLMALGALGGDAIESFFKRRLGIPSGHAWFPFDQLDYIIGGALAALPFVVLYPWQYIWLVVLWLVIHLIASYVGWRMGLKERPI